MGAAQKGSRVSPRSVATRSRNGAAARAHDGTGEVQSRTGPLKGGGAAARATATGAVPRLALTRSEAAEALGMSLDSFERHVQSHVRLVRRGKLRLVPVRELERWLEASAARVFD